ncbi:MAG TPA: ABC transporter permease [Fibrobacteria bacterium]|nr:ABC transporter permease [Fibrobacteria bacterium]HOX53300.1 ABC transporter permease [Fibrobacteria bacterium]
MSSSGAIREVRIGAADPPVLQSLVDLWAARGLFSVLVWRQINIRYAQTFFGMVWMLLQPGMTGLLYWLVFGVFVKVPTQGVPYPLFVLSGIVIWTVFSQGMERGSASLIQDERLITKVYFPRLLLPLSATVSVLADFVVSLVILAPICMALGLAGVGLLWIPVALVPTLLMAGGMGMLFSSLNIRFRDLRQIAPFLVQAWIWATPVAYPLEVVPAPWVGPLLANPMSAPVLLFRHALTGSALPPLWSVWTSLIGSVVIFLFGAWVFRRVEKDFADYI